MATCQEILEIFKLDDKEFNEAVRSLPVSDINAVSEGFLNGPCFSEFIQKYAMANEYESEFQKNIAKAISVFVQERTGLPKKLSLGARNEILSCINKAEMQRVELREKRKKGMKKGMQWLKKIDKAPSYEYICQVYPRLEICRTHIMTDRMVLGAIAELNMCLYKSKDRLSRLRRDEFRKAVIMNHDYYFTPWLMGQDEKETFKFHETKIDRLVIDVYSPELLTYDKILKEKIDKSRKEISEDHNKKDIPSLLYAEVLKTMHEYDNQTIDEMLEDFQRERTRRLINGYDKQGTLIFESEYGKQIFTYAPMLNGSPIRLRVITNIQNMVQRELVKDPQIKAWYESHIWYKGSETNFIPEEHYPVYLKMEKQVCRGLENYFKELFLDKVQEKLKTTCSWNSIIVYVSQVEVCYEEPFQKNRIEVSPFIRNRVKATNKHLVQYFNEIFLEYFHKIGTYANLKWENETKRPMFYCDIPSMDPTMAMMQYKVYPKYRDNSNRIMIRHEYIPTKFIKYYKPLGSSLPVAGLVLESPDLIRELTERLFQFEMINNRLLGQGYNGAYKQMDEGSLVRYQRKLHAKALFGNTDISKSESRIQNMIDTGLVPKKLHKHTRKVMEGLGTIIKIKRGEYRLTEAFQASMGIEPLK